MRPRSDPLNRQARAMSRDKPLGDRIMALLRIEPLESEELSRLLKETFLEIQREILMLRRDRQVFRVRSWRPGRPFMNVTSTKGWVLSGF